MIGIAWMVLSRAHAGPIIADVAGTYGRNLGQQLNIAGLAAEVKLSILPYVAVGGRIGGQVGVAVTDGEARGWLAMPLLVKVEASPLATRTRPFVGLGSGVTMVRAGGAYVVLSDTGGRAAAWKVRGPVPTVMPEVGVDVGGFRIAVDYTLLLGSRRAVAESATVSGTGEVTVGDHAPGLNGFAVQLGAHFGGPGPD